MSIMDIEIKKIKTILRFFTYRIHSLFKKLTKQKSVKQLKKFPFNTNICTNRDNNYDFKKN